MPGNLADPDNVTVPLSGMQGRIYNWTLKVYIVIDYLPSTGLLRIPDVQKS